MRLVKVIGKIWDLTCLTDDRYISDNLTEAEANNRVIKGLNIGGSADVLKGGLVKSKAIAIIEIAVNGYLRQEPYNIYYNKQGFYCNVQNKRIYLRNLI